MCAGWGWRPPSRGRRSGWNGWASCTATAKRSRRRRTDRLGDVGWDGSELVAFRLHLPSKIAYHTAGKDNLLRGNILLWEQPLTARLAGDRLEMEARMEPTSILYRTLWLFAGSMLAALSVLAAIIWWVVKKREGTDGS